MLDVQRLNEHRKLRDPRRLQIGRVLIATGLDATDVASTTSFGCGAADAIQSHY